MAKVKAKRTRVYTNWKNSYELLEAHYLEMESQYNEVLKENAALKAVNECRTATVLEAPDGLTRLGMDVLAHNRFCVVGDSRTGAGPFHRKWFDDQEKAASHAADIIRHKHNSATTELYVMAMVQIIGRREPVQPPVMTLPPYLAREHLPVEK